MTTPSCMQRPGGASTAACHKGFEWSPATAVATRYGPGGVMSSLTLRPGSASTAASHRGLDCSPATAATTSAGTDPRGLMRTGHIGRRAQRRCARSLLPGRHDVALLPGGSTGSVGDVLRCGPGPRRQEFMPGDTDRSGGQGASAGFLFHWVCVLVAGWFGCSGAGAGRWCYGHGRAVTRASFGSFIDCRERAKRRVIWCYVHGWSS